MDILIKKNIDDPRESRDQKLKKGTVLTVENNEMWNALIKSKKAEIKKPLVTPILKDADDAEKFEQEKIE